MLMGNIIESLYTKLQNLILMVNINESLLLEAPKIEFHGIHTRESLHEVPKLNSNGKSRVFTRNSKIEFHGIHTRESLHEAPKLNSNGKHNRESLHEAPR